MSPLVKASAALCTVSHYTLVTVTVVHTRQGDNYIHPLHCQTHRILDLQIFACSWDIGLLKSVLLLHSFAAEPHDLIRDGIGSVELLRRKGRVVGRKGRDVEKRGDG